MPPPELTPAEQLAYLTEVAAHLPGATPEQGEAPFHPLKLHLEGYHLPVVVHFDRRQASRVEFVAAWDYWGGKHYPSGGPNLAASYARTRPPAQVAADLARRFVPAFRDWCDRAQRELSKDQEFCARRDAALTRLAQAFGVPVPDAGREDFHFGEDHYGYGDVTVASTYADLHLRSVPIEVAERLLALYREMIDGPQREPA